jgi:integrase/recombinase XerD
MPQARVLNESEIRKVLKAISFRRHATRDRTIFLLGLYSGMRAKELCSVRVCDVLTKDSDVRDEIHLTSDQTKGKRGRTVILGKKARDLIKNYLCERYKTTDLQPLLLTDTSRPLFTTQKNPRRGFSPNTLAGHFCTLMREAKIEGGSSHSMRRSFITSLADKGVSVRVLQELAGHANLQTTAKYIAVNDAVMRRAVDLV